MSTTQLHANYGLAKYMNILGQDHQYHKKLLLCILIHTAFTAKKYILYFLLTVVTNIQDISVECG